MWLALEVMVTYNLLGDNDPLYHLALVGNLAPPNF